MTAAGLRRARGGVQPGDRVAQGLQVGDLGVQVTQPHGEQILYVVARGVAAVTDVENVADLRQRQPGRAAPPDEVQPPDRVLVVLPVPSGGASGRVQTVPEMREFVGLAKLSEFPQLADEQGVIWKRFGMTAQSTFVVLDAEGAVTARGHVDPAELPGRLDKLLEG